MNDGDVLKKVRSGDALDIPAAAYNAFVDAADFTRRQNRGGDGRPGPGFAPGIVLVKNTGNGDLDRFGVLAIDDVIVAPADGLDEFKNNFAFVGVTPASEYLGQFVILAEDVLLGAFGRAYVYGCCPVKVEVTNDNHGFADLLDSTEKLFSGNHGNARILWKESGLGTKWAIVRLADSDSGAIPVQLLKDGGLNGGMSSGTPFYATYTYSIYAIDVDTSDPDVTPLATGLTPQQNRPKGPVIHSGGKQGMAYRLGGEWILLYAGEQLDVGKCS